jgi:ATP-binding cassette subfamily F protein uup
MVAQRGRGVDARANGTLAEAPREKPAKERPAERAPAKAKLSFKEQHALTTLPAKMEELRGKRAKLQALLDDAELYAKDPAKFARASEMFAAVETELAAAEEEWLELEIKREEIEG